MKQIVKIIFSTAILMVVTIIIFSFSSVAPNKNSMENKLGKTYKVSESAVELKVNMRKLWEDHILWTRNVIFCLVDNLPGTDQAVKRLLQNQIDIGNAFKPCYGEEAGKKLTELLTPHITISAEVIKAAKAGNIAALDEANKRWYANSDEISEFLCKINPQWPLDDMKTMMREHLKITTDEVMQRINKNYFADVIAFDKIRTAILKMADMFADGMVKQFPKKFESCKETSKLN